MDPPIVITGGSIHIDLPRELSLGPSNVTGEYVSTNKRILRVQVTGPGLTDYEVTPTDGQVTIRIYYEDVP